MLRTSRTLAAGVAAALVGAAACAPEIKPLARAEFERPQRVLVVAIDREPSASSPWRPGLSLGLGFGSFGSHVGGGVDFSHESGGGAAAVRAQLKAWDFRTALQRVFLSKAAPPATWTWVDGDMADPAVVDQIDKMYDHRDAKAPLLPGYAASHRIDKVLVIDPISWGLKGDEGFFVELRGRLFEPTESRQLIWEDRGHPSRARRPFFEPGSDNPRDVEAVHRALLDSAAESAVDLVAGLEKGPAS